VHQRNSSKATIDVASGGARNRGDGASVGTLGPLRCESRSRDMSRILPIDKLSDRMGRTLLSLILEWDRRRRYRKRQKGDLLDIHSSQVQNSPINQYKVLHQQTRPPLFSRLIVHSTRHHSTVRPIQSFSIPCTSQDHATPRGVKSNSPYSSTRALYA
jgi:hypothetical protein